MATECEPFLRLARLSNRHYNDDDSMFTSVSLVLLTNPSHFFRHHRLTLTKSRAGLRFDFLFFQVLSVISKLGKETNKINEITKRKSVSDMENSCEFQTNQRYMSKIESFNKENDVADSGWSCGLSRTRADSPTAKKVGERKKFQKSIWTKVLNALSNKKPAN